MSENLRGELLAMFTDVMTDPALKDKDIQVVVMIRDPVIELFSIDKTDRRIKHLLREAWNLHRRLTIKKKQDNSFVEYVEYKHGQ